MNFKELIFGQKKSTEENLTISSFGAFNFWLYLAFFLTGSFFYLLGMNFPGKEHRTLNQIKNNPAWRALQDISDSLQQSDNWTDTTYAMAKWYYKNINRKEIIPPFVANVKRQNTWEQTVLDIKASLIPCTNWFDTLNVLSTWLYQNTRVGESEYNIDRTFGNDFNKWSDTVRTLDAKWFYNINNSDSIVNDCGSHCYFASRLYEYFHIKSLHLSMKKTSSPSQEGHMINVVQNPHNQKWYMVDHFFGIRYRYNGELLDIETYMKLSKKQLRLIEVEPFGTVKFQIYPSPFGASRDCCYDETEVVWVEPANHKNNYRIIAPYTLRKRFVQFKPLFDTIAASYEMPPHVDWIDLARRMPMYSARLFSPFSMDEQAQADSLLDAWRNQSE